MAMTPAQRTMVVDNAGVATLFTEYILKHSQSYGDYTLTADGFWTDAFGNDTKPTSINGCTKAQFLAAYKAGVDAGVA